MRRKSRVITLGNIKIGGDAPVSIQSMTNTDTRDVRSTVSQIKKLEGAGCEIVRVAVPDMEAAGKLGEIKSGINIPLIADIHFDYKLALRALQEGADGLRLNPGNIGNKWKVKEVVSAARDKGVPIRIGVNAGSLDKDLWEKYGGPTAEAMAESAMMHIGILEDMDFREIKVSLKASDIERTVDAYRILSEKVDYPFHIGISEAGTFFSGTVKSAIGIGILLHEGIGDTIRVSLTGDPVEEVRVGLEILKSLRIRQSSPEIISCPTCGRCEIDLEAIALKIEEAVKTIKKPIKIAVMGCVVNGPGEAREADLGVAGGKGVGLIFRKGKVVRKVREEEIYEALLEEIKMLED
ncbi:MAG: flavodoxin-dependent (E)-4-hydroxy-3-methylbut-2-enyl-diphosphate synthase [Nitrospinae bacterium]|nr:flavodoxin-dependent (E)-4-hydroxy-3-methylbut-2-enyl-diphosphate synthase [Nitrospinota bacterium]